MRRSRAQSVSGCAFAGLRAAVLLSLAAAPLAGQGGRRSGDEFASPGDMPMRMMQRQPVFFPPLPPALGQPIGRSATPSEGRPPAPPELGPYVSEFFYPALGARLHSNTLKDSHRQQLAAYRAAKAALLAELREEIGRQHGAGTGARALAFAALARRQAPRLAQLEKDAEQLRRDLNVGDHTWGALREWRLGDRDRRGFSPLEIAQVMRSYAFYQNGLLPSQRRLLREIFLELIMAADNQEKAAAAQPHIFFPPEPARVLFPEDMPADAAAKLATFQTRKSQLKKELYDAIYRHDGENFGFLRGHTISALVSKQTARLDELETLAEEVRRLVPPEAPPPVRKERSPLPVALTERIDAMMQAYTTAQNEAAGRIDRIVAAARGLPFQSNYRFDADGLKFVVVPTRFAARDPAAVRKIERLRAEISAIAEEYGRRLADLLNERGAIRTAIGEALATTKDDVIDRALLAGMRVAHQRQNEAAYDEYRGAVFEPGLSPAQRRLLFDAVVEKFDLPLPRGEYQPVTRGNSW